MWSSFAHSTLPQERKVSKEKENVVFEEFFFFFLFVDSIGKFFQYLRS
jgi:hypothetical protein